MLKMNKIQLAFSLIAILAVTLLTMAGDSESAATTEHRVIVAVAEASKAWKEAFNAGDAAAATALYEKDAVMVVDPFGTFTGHEEIRAFWTKLVEGGYDDVVYRNTKMEVLNETSARVSADWSMNKASGVITNELWVIQTNGKALLREDHFAVNH